MTFSLHNPVRPWTGWLSLLLLLPLLLPCAQAQQHSSNGTALPATAYLVASMQEPSEPSNHSFNNLLAILRSDPPYDSIVITEDYSIGNPQGYPTDKPIHLSKSLLITSPPGQQNTLSFEFLVNMVQLNNHTVTLRNIIFGRARKTSGHSVPFFSGYGTLIIADAVRMRIACPPDIGSSFQAAKNAPRVAGFPGKQVVQLINMTVRGVLYPDSIQAVDMVVSVGPGDVEDGAEFTSYVVVYRNATRTCARYVSKNCNNQCLERTIDELVAQENPSTISGPKQQQLVSRVVPAVVVPTVLLVVGGVLAAVLLRHKPWRGHLGHAGKLQQGVAPSAADGSFHGGPAHFAGVNGQHGRFNSFPNLQHTLQGRGSTPKLAAAVSFEQLAGRAAAAQSDKGWKLIACHTAPEFSGSTAQDVISLGVLLGAGSFGRVYRGRWQSRDVAVKVMHHDGDTAASVANEVDLVMSFRHPNVTAAYQCRTWSCAHAEVEDATSQTAAAEAPASSHRQDFWAVDCCGSKSAHGTATYVNFPRPDSGSVSHSVLAEAATPSTTWPEAHLEAAASASGWTSNSVHGVHQRVLSPSQLSVIPLRDADDATMHDSTGTTSFNSFAVTAESHAVWTSTAPLQCKTTEAGVLHSSKGPDESTVSTTCQSFSSDQDKVTLQQATPSRNACGALSPMQAADLQHGCTTAALTPDTAAAGFRAATAAAHQQLHNFAASRHDQLAAWSMTSTAPPQTQLPACHGLGFACSGTGDMSTHQQTVIGGDHTASDWQPCLPSHYQAVCLPPLQPSEPALSLHALQQPLLLLPPAPQQQEHEQLIPVLSVSTTACSMQPLGLQMEQHCIDLSELPQTSSSRAMQEGSGPSQQQQHQATAPAATSATSKSTSADKIRAAVEVETWIILEYCDGGTLFDLMREGRLNVAGSPQVDMVHLLVLLSDVAAGMKYLHMRNCVHGDLKPANLLLQRHAGSVFGCVVKVSDFGLSRSLTTGQSHRSTRMVGTFIRAAPELLRLGRLSPACDVYAFGILMWELYTGAVAFSGAHYGQVFEQVVLLKERPSIPPGMPERYTTLMSACWAQDPVARPTFDVIKTTIRDMLRHTPNIADRFVSDL